MALPRDVIHRLAALRIGPARADPVGFQKVGKSILRINVTFGSTLNDFGIMRERIGPLSVPAALEGLVLEAE